MHGVELFLVLLAAVAAVSAVARRLGLQASIVLVLAGILPGALPGVPRIELDPGSCSRPGGC